jgi:UrcA family protein
MKTLLFTLSTAGAVLAASPALAGTVSIAHHDLDLSTAEGQETLKHRIDAAARAACGYDDVRTGTILRSRHAERCYAEVKKQATEQFATLIAEDRLGG